MKTILALTGGSDTDAAVFDTAFAAASALGGHIDFLHIRISPAEAARFTPHFDFASGEALRTALDELRFDETERSRIAFVRFEAFCRQNAIAIVNDPAPGNEISAAWHEEQDYPIERMMLHARHNDLVVTGRRSGPNGLPSDLIERLLLGSGKPLLIAPSVAKKKLTGTVLVCWKENETAARALGAAVPLLAKSEHVVIVTAEETGAGSPAVSAHLARQLAWHGIRAETSWLPAGHASIPAVLESASARFDAGLLVMGGFSRGRLREVVFGGCTQYFLDNSTLPVLMMH
jgi:nucleotide-binding universal stress UspA family protein